MKSKKIAVIILIIIMWAGLILPLGAQQKDEEIKTLVNNFYIALCKGDKDTLQSLFWKTVTIMDGNKGTVKEMDASKWIGIIAGEAYKDYKLNFTDVKIMKKVALASYDYTFIENDGSTIKGHEVLIFVLVDNKWYIVTEAWDY